MHVLAVRNGVKRVLRLSACESTGGRGRFSVRSVAGSGFRVLDTSLWNLPVPEELPQGGDLAVLWLVLWRFGT